MHFGSHLRLINGAVIISLMLIAVANAQAPAIQITNPPSGIVVNPAGIISITVSVNPSQPLTGVQVIARDIGVSQVVTAPPYKFDMTVPQVQPGTRSLVAVGVTSSGSLVQSAPIVVDVELASGGAVVTSLQPELTSAGFSFIGQQIALPSVDAILSDGTKQHISASTEVHVQSLNTRIVVAEAGTLTAVGSGKATINIQYGGKSTTVSVSVPGSIRGDLTGHGIVDLDDLAVIQAALNTSASRDPATGKDIDARDLNGDGVINIEDARILTTLCTYPRCAPHP